MLARAACRWRTGCARWGGKGDRVVLCLPRGIGPVYGDPGVLRTGAAYVPSIGVIPRTASPSSSRIAAGADRHHRPRARRYRASAGLDAELGIWPPSRPRRGRDVTGSDPKTWPISSTPRHDRAAQRGDDHPCQCLSLVRSESAILALEPSDIVFGRFSLAFDMSSRRCGALFRRAKLLVATDRWRERPDVAIALAAEKTTIWHVVLADRAGRASGAELALINMGGEACPADLPRRLARPGLRLLNTYGPTETSVTATWTEVQPGKRITIASRCPAIPPGSSTSSCSRSRRAGGRELVIGGPGVGVAMSTARPDRREVHQTPFDTYRANQSASIARAILCGWMRRDIDLSGASTRR